MNKKYQIISAVLLTVSIGGFSALPSSAADMNLPIIDNNRVSNVTGNTSQEYKSELINKLGKIDQFSALFEQEVIDNAGNVLQRGGGDLAVKRPNLVHWNTTSPDESLIVSDGKSIFLFDPFIEQVTAYKLDGAIANTPILLITTNNKSLWDQYSVSRTSKNNYVIHANDVNSRIKTLEINFNDKSELSGFTFLDVTGQLSKVLLKNVNLSPNLAPSLFTFTIPEGAHLDDQR
ncbi:outer membrane lipoprotein chaperone LolA [Colwellia sp. UCD-KL20]|uniref:outer membrane lipoprotein chaperone LolA n=1 Tax=Colwellia sp. UCD-KL20 TaxID=1917165 RepID=UPI00097054D7|nr:outer membrane lipoprotein chaperone LolA [Colwellia sp. UCD-KL20]